ncbi:acyltransferase family protein [Herbaspirillum rubrisubalbicans]|uniref:acyltransferase family protein n=1 Tax=Herbaspirillum rubrisubalbicans TaxID=80842 RepID=UPI000DD352DF|nr:acyltransferase [Herbaspirillum rubrisubalbicans]
MSQYKINNIQGLRAVAALFVLLAHLGGVGNLYPYVPKFNAGWGVFGVDVFFVISGFIMFYVTRSNWGDGWTFLLLRANRIYPLWWICLLISAPWMGAYFVGRIDEYFSYSALSFFLLPALSPSGELYPPLSVGWTLIYELLFYCIFALLMLTQRRFISLKTLIVFLILFGIGNILSGKTAIKVLLSNSIYLEFVFGIAIAEATLSKRLSPSLAFAGAVVGVGMAIIIVIAPKLTPAQFEACRFIWYGLPAACLVLAAVWLENAKITVSHWLVSLGNASYAIYLTHELFVINLPPWLHTFSLFSNGILLVLSLGFLSVLGGFFVYLFVDRPIHHWTSSFLRKQLRPVTSS